MLQLLLMLLPASLRAQFISFTLEPLTGRLFLLRAKALMQRESVAKAAANKVWQKLISGEERWGGRKEGELQEMQMAAHSRTCTRWL